jgi:uncharacterized protein (DUF885 family)
MTPRYLSLLILWTTATIAPALGAESADEKFEQLSAEFLRTHFQQRPLDAVALGWHQYDGLFPRLDREALEAEVRRLAAFDERFARFRPSRLSPGHRLDLDALQPAIRAERWKFEVQRAPWANPMFYAGAVDVSLYLKRDWAPLPDRVRSMTAILGHAPAVMRAARANLAPVLARPFVETAIEIAEGSAAFIEKDVSAAAARVKDPALVSAFQSAASGAIAAHRDFATWLRTARLTNATASPALGTRGFRAMLRTERIGLSPDEVLAVGLREMRAEQARMREAAARIDPSLSPARVYEEISKEHPTAADLIPHARRTLEKARQFVADRRLMTIPTEVRARVEETLPPFRSTSTASMDTPGPFETRATQAYYYVTPVEPDWSSRQAEEWLRSLNRYTLEVVNIHEAYPGHYFQFARLNQTPLGAPSKIFTSYAFTEGWAHYCEQMMLEEGYGGGDPVVAAKYQVAQSSEALLRICRLCVAVRMHCHGMSVDQATRFIMENCYYEEKAARPEAMRGSFDPGYCFYTLGKLQLLKLRADWKAQEGDAFSLQRFHDEVLRHGAPEIRTLRERMLRDPRSWDRIL